ncbi:MAG: porin family protein, partial [Pseudomonadales bacterium]|nr:porin family protein [Pseudomonadales bacterium]
MKTMAISLALSAGMLTGGPIVWASESSLAKDGLSINPGIGYYNFDTDMNVEDESFPSLGLEYRLSNNFAIEGTYITTETSAVGNSGADFDWSHYHLDALYYFNANRKLQPYLAAGAGEGAFSYSDSRSSDDETLLNVGGGVKYFFTPALSLRGDFRVINSQDNEMTAGAATVSLSWLLGRSTSADGQGEFDLTKSKVMDADKDSIIDAIDLCPGTPPSIAVDSKGCALDLDRDGIADYRDKCPSTVANIPVNSVGCPQDLDQDGIADYKDKC